jgi:NTE family protein
MSTPDRTDESHDGLALALGGGGARAAYQVGVLREIAERFPALGIPVLTGVSAGGINIAYLANHTGTFLENANGLSDLWLSLEPWHVFRTDAYSLLSRAGGIAFRMVLGRAGHEPGGGAVDSSPLRQTLARALGADGLALSGITTNVDSGRLKAVALTATCYSTGQTVTFFRGHDIPAWERPQRRSENVELTVDHAMASAALPLIFPPVRIGDLYYGDGGMRLVAPFAAAVHLGADRILAVSTRYRRGQEEANRPLFTGPPSAAQVIGLLYNAIFLDMLDQDALTMERLSRLVGKVPPAGREGLRPVGLLLIRPSRDLGALANRFEPRLPATLRFLTRRLGTQRSRTQDLLSALMFQSQYVQALHDLGRRDAEARMDEIAAFLADDASGRARGS